MKISQIEIKDYNQFKDFTLDLTYPEGHEKAGQPLDKVCFIGQSGTGKTSLLNICNEVTTIQNFGIATGMLPDFQIAVSFNYENVLKKKNLNS